MRAAKTRVKELKDINASLKDENERYIKDVFLFYIYIYIYIYIRLKIKPNSVRIRF